MARPISTLAVIIRVAIRPEMTGNVGKWWETVRSAGSIMRVIASTQVQRADRMLIEFSGRVDQTFTLLQQRILAPAKQGAALMAGMRAALTALRGFRDSPGRRRASTVDEDDALFIG